MWFMIKEKDFEKREKEAKRSLREKGMVAKKANVGEDKVR